MRVFRGSLQEFQAKLITNDLFSEIERNYVDVLGRTASPSERNSWRASLPRLEAVLRLANLSQDVAVTLEERIPYFSKRIDACLFGHTADGTPSSIIVELKAWSEAVATDDGNVEVGMGGGVQEHPHPSAQARGYHEHLEDFRRAYQGVDRIHLASCAYCHNYPGIIPDEGLFHPQFDALRTASPTFGERDAAILARYLNVRLAGGRGEPVIDAYDRSGIGPSRQLIDHASEMIRQQSVFRLLDEQIAANNAILRAIQRASKTKSKHVILVRGGPGTGKSVIALNALGEVLRRELKVFLVSGSSAFTHGMRKILGRRVETLIRFTDFFWDAPENSVDVLIVDEAHRIRAKSIPRVPTYLRPKISQIEELMRAARVTVFFVDEHQIISPEEMGDPAMIRETARQLHANYQEFTLTSQFRCNGSDTYLTWLDDVLAIHGASEGIKLATPTGFDFQLVDSPHALVDYVQARNLSVSNSARLLAGWCWPWSDPLPDRLVDDIVIGDFHFPWEAKNGHKPPPGIPEAKHWAIDPAGVGQAGTVYSVQGFETKHIGVIIGPDLIMRNGTWIAQAKQNHSNSIRRCLPAQALPYIKQIYRTLLSRGIQSCRVYCVDSETRNSIESRLIYLNP